MKTMKTTPLTTGEAARVLEVSPDRVRQLHRLGRLSAARTPRGVRIFDRAEVERLRAQRENKRHTDGAR